MQLYNTPKKQIETIEPQTNEQVTVYTCGPTVYDYPHIGNWFTFIRYDVLIRALKISGYKPNWVMNITDVGHLVSDADDGEDKLEKGAKREGKTAWDVAAFYSNYFIKGLERLNITPPTTIPKATDHIAEQIELVKQLEAKGLTYVIDDGVYFDTSTFPNYAKFAGLDLEDQQAGARVEYNTKKRNPSDFALWKFSPKDQTRDMEWWAPWQAPGNNSDEKQQSGQPRITGSSILHDSGEARTESYTKYGEEALEHEALQDAEKTGSAGGSASSQARLVSGSWGFPGWHLECSAMAMKYLGETLDIHAGGIDHIPVHHTNEIAQSEGATGQPFSNYWMHANHITIGGEKISKSLGNTITLEEIEAKGFSLEAFRLYVLESHYRTQSKFTWEGLEAAQNRLKNYWEMADLKWQLVPDDEGILEGALHNHIEAISKSLQQDLNTPEALSTLSSLELATKTSGISLKNKQVFQDTLELIDNYLGLKLSHRANVTEDQASVINQRIEAKKNQDWARSDQLRDQLAGEGIGLRDTANGAIWYRL